MQILTVVGATGLIIYGMKLMSESVQKIAGDKMRIMLSNMASNRVKGIFMGTIITAMVQSSSATTVMVVSFANAGFIMLGDAIAVIIGANIGTTFTTWIIALIGFRAKFVHYTLPLIGVGIPFIFSKNRKLKNWGELVLGFSLLFIALNFLSTGVPQYQANNWLSDTLKLIVSNEYLGNFSFLIIGAIFTVLVKSSSAIFALALVLCMNGWIAFEPAAAMVLGANIGTTFSAMYAARIANATAKRAALSHFLFNFLGSIWAIALLPYFVNSINNLYDIAGKNSPLQNFDKIPVSLALFHSSFNIINAVIMGILINSIKQLVTRIIPSSGKATEAQFKLTHIKIGLLSTPDASIFQAKRETIVFAERVRKMFRNTERLLNEKNEKEYQILHEKLMNTEDFSNRLEKEIALYLTKVAEGRLSESASRRLRSLFKMIDDIESISDSCINIMRAIDKQRERKITYPEQIMNNLGLMFNMVNDALDTMVTMLTHEEVLDLSAAEKIEQGINDYRDILKSEHLDNLEKGIYNYDAGIIYNDIISQCERIGDFAINVDEASKNQY